jgi:hypothetical protein
MNKQKCMPPPPAVMADIILAHATEGLNISDEFGLYLKASLTNSFEKLNQEEGYSTSSDTSKKMN